jgi:protein O-mannosyl-transferase
MSKRNRSKPALQAGPKGMFPSTRSLPTLAGVALIVFAASIAYLPSLSGGFLLDDNVLLTENPLIKASDGLYRIWCTTEAYDYWPVTNTTLWLEWRLWGMNPTGYHVTNLFLHIADVVLIWVILRRLSIPGAYLAALLLAVHPVNVQSVAWIAQRKNLMAMLFFLLAIVSYLQVEGQSRPRRGSVFICEPRYWLSLAAFALAMLSKGSVAILPLLLLLILWWMRPLRMEDVIRTAPFFVVAGALTIVNIWFQAHGKDVEIRHADFVERLLGAGGVVWFYLYKAILPIDLLFIYPQWHIQVDHLLWWLPLLAAVCATWVLWWYRAGSTRPLLFAWAFFCVSLVPVLGFVDVGHMRYSLVADHYQHVALIGVLALMAAGWDEWRRRGAAQWLPNAAAAMAAGALAFLTWQQSSQYVDPITLYKATLRGNPDSWMMHYNLGVVLATAGRSTEAIHEYQETLRLTNYAEAQNNLGALLFATNRPSEAIEHFEEALRLKPDYADAANNLGTALTRMGRLAEAIERYQETLRLDPDYAEAHNNLGTALTQAGRLPEAIEHYEVALRLKPDYAEAHYNLGNALTAAGQLPEAIHHYEQALKLQPNYPDAHHNLQIVQDRLRRARRLHISGNL